MPKSRGRKQTKTRRAITAPSSWQGVVIRAARPLLDPEEPRSLAEVFASGLLGNVWAGRGLGDTDILDAWLGQLLEHARRRGTRDAAVVVAAFGTVLSHPLVQAELDDWARALLVDLPWVSAPPAVPLRASRSDDPWRDVTVWFLHYGDEVLVTSTQRSEAGAVTTASLLEPESVEDWDEGRVAGFNRRSDVSVDDAVGALMVAQRTTEMTYPYSDDEGYVTTGHLLAARLAATGVQRPSAGEWTTLAVEDRTALVDAFLAESPPTLDEESVREIADLCLLYGDSYFYADPLAWSPHFVEEFLLNWLPRKTVLEPQVFSLVPTVTHDFVEWALLRNGVAKKWAKQAASVALEVADEFHELYDETDRGPAAVLGRMISAAGIDPTDDAALARIVEQYNAEHARH